MRRFFFASFTAGLSLLVFVLSAAAAVVSGTIDSVSPGSNQLTVKVGKQGTSKVFKLAPAAQVTLQGKKAELLDLEAGQSVTITTDSSGELVTKVIARASVGGTAPKTDPASATPKAKTKKTATRSADVSVAPGDWPQFRGPRRDNISDEKGLLKEWPAGGPKLAWKTTGLGEGYGSVAVVGDLVFTMGTIGDNEHLFALSRYGGDKKWSIRTGQNRNDGMGGGPRSTPTVDGDRVYALGANGDLVAANAETGQIGWRLNILNEFNARNIGWGISESVLIDGEKLICTPGGRGATMVALNKLNGQPLWRSAVQGNPAAGYASAIAIEVGGVRQYVNFVHTGVIGVRASDGTPLWGQRESANGTANCSSQVYADGNVFSASGYGTGGALFRLTAGGGQTRSELVYETKQMKNHHGGMVLLDGYVYGFDENILTCLDLQTGKPAWQNRSVGKGSLTYADGHLYLRSENGPIALVEAQPREYVEKGRFEQPDRSRRQAWAHPVVAGGRLYIRDQDTLLVYDVQEN